MTSLANTEPASSTLIGSEKIHISSMVNASELHMNRSILKNTMSPAVDARATPTMTNRSAVRIVDDAPPSPKSPQTSLVSRKRAFLMHALSQIETEITRMRHAQKTAHDLEANLRNRRVALIEQEMEMHERRCDYLEVLRKFSGDKDSAPSSRDSHSPSSLAEETTKGTKRSKFEGAEMGNPASKKLRMHTGIPSIRRATEPLFFLPPSQSPRWMSQNPVSPMGGSVPFLEQPSLTVLSEMAMRLLGSTGIGQQPPMLMPRRPSMAQQGSALIAHQRQARSPNKPNK